MGTAIPHSERGASSVEYALLIVFIAAVIIGTVALVGLDLLGVFESFEDQIGGSQN